MEICISSYFTEIGVYLRLAVKQPPTYVSTQLFYLEMTLFWQKTSLKIEKDSYLSQNIDILIK